MPQAPQLLGSLRRFAQRPAEPPTAPHKVCPGPHEPAQVPAEHVVAPPIGGEHARPHAAQLLTLVLRLVSQPFAGLPSQSPKPGAQRSTHAPLVHVAL